MIEVKPIVVATAITPIQVSEKPKPIVQQAPKPAPRVTSYEGMKMFRPQLRFDTRNENKISTLKNLPLIVNDPAAIKKVLPNNEKPAVLNLPSPLKTPVSPIGERSDDDKTPINQNAPELSVSDTETELTGQVLTETELSDWTADDVVSENFVDIEFAINSNKGTIKKNRKNKKKNGVHALPLVKPAPDLRAPLALDVDELEFMDTGSEDSIEMAPNNRIMLKNSGYIEFIPNGSQTHNSNAYSYKSDSAYSSSPKTIPDKRDEFQSLDSAGSQKSIAGIDYIEQGASILSNTSGDSTFLRTPINDENKTSSPSYTSVSMAGSLTSSLGSSLSTLKNSDQQPDSLNDMEDDSLVMINSTETVTTTEESDALTVVTSPLDSTPANIVTTESSDTKTLDDLTSSSDKKHELIKQISDEMSYEVYVKKLQAKISQITSQDPGRRRSSGKGETTSSEQSLKESHLVKHSPYSEAITEPPTLSKKIELITKERVKQKDIIHDLVMDKLQQKKRLNAEKRLNRSRNRSSALSSAVNSPSHGTPPIQDSPVKINPLLMQQNMSPPEASSTKSRIPYTTRQVPLKDNSDMNGNNFKPPMSYAAAFAYTDKLRLEARERARLKSNEDLGLSPEEKIQQIRKKYNLYPKSVSVDRPNVTTVVSAVPAMAIPERKLISSKSVNDILLCNNPAYSSVYNIERPSIREIYQMSDFTSDPNLNEPEKHLRDRKLSRKDPERRRSLIQTVSDFFHKKKDGSSSSSSSIKDPAMNRQGQNNDGMFGRFRLSSKKKDDNKSKVSALKTIFLTLNLLTKSRL